MKPMFRFPESAEELRQMSPAEWTIMKSQIIRDARIARNDEIRQAFKHAFGLLVQAGRAIAGFAKVSPLHIRDK